VVVEIGIPNNNRMVPLYRPLFSRISEYEAEPFLSEHSELPNAL